MKLYIKLFLKFFVLFVSVNTLSQEIDSSIVESLNDDQINLVKEALQVNSANQPTIDKEPNNNKDQESLEDNEIDEKSQTSLTKFGYDFISTSPTSIIATGDLPLPNDYKISLGDTLGVILSGSKEQIFDLRVQLDGTVFFPELGSISVAGESFEDVKIKFRNLIEQSYIGVEIDLALKNLRAKKISIIGAVKKPGTYLVNPFTTISNSLAYSGGIDQFGSLRNIKLIRSNGETFFFDLYDFLIDGDRSSDITIESGDVVIVGAANKFIEIKGQIKRPGTYEVLEGEDLSDLLRYALGFSGGANYKKITLSKLDFESSSILKIITSDTSHSLQDVLSVDIYPYNNQMNSGILVRGSIKEPGYYSLDEYETLEDIISNVEFIDVYPWLAVLEQFDEENLIKNSILFSLNDPSTYKSIKLLPNSKIFFAGINSRFFDVDAMTSLLIKDYDLTINHKQGVYTLPVYGKYSLKSFVDLLGLDMSDVNEVATYISPLESLVITENYKKMHYVAKKYNTVTFRSPINDLIRVSISGAVDYPGAYTLQANSTLQDLYELVGNFKNEAFVDGIIFSRESVRDRQSKAIQKSKEDLNKAILTSVQKGENIGDIGIIRALSETIEPDYLGRIAGDFSPNSFSAMNTVLFSGDRVIVPKNPNTINILGEVLNPISIQYEKSISIRSAISNAGGYQDYADKNKIYVIKANGLIEKANRNIFVRDTKLGPGDTVIVPRKIITNNPGIEALVPLTQILSNLAFSAAAIESLSNSN